MATSVPQSESSCATDSVVMLDLPAAKFTVILELAARLRVLDALLGRLLLEGHALNPEQRTVLQRTYLDQRGSLDLFLDHLAPDRGSSLRRTIDAMVPLTIATVAPPETAAGRMSLRRLLHSVSTLSTAAAQGHGEH